MDSNIKESSACSNEDQFITLKNSISLVLKDKLQELEIRNEIQEKEILDLMFELHSHTNQIDEWKTFVKVASLKLNLNLFSRESNFRHSDDKLNTSMSVITKRSVSTTNRSGFNKFYGKPSIRKKQPQPEPKKVIISITKAQVPVQIKSVQIETVNHMGNKNRKFGSSKNLSGGNKGQTAATTPSKFNQITLKKNSNIIRQNFKFEPKKKGLSGSCSGSLQLTNNETPFNKESSQKSEHSMSSLLLLASSHSRTNSESVKQKISLNLIQKNSSMESNQILGLSYMNQEISQVCSSKMLDFFNSKKNTVIFLLIIEFLGSKQEKLRIKNCSKIARHSFFFNELDKLDKNIDYKLKLQNPFFRIKITDIDIFSKKLILSQIKNKLERSQDIGFHNIVIFIYLILTMNLTPILDTEFIISELENKILDQDRNVYGKYDQIISNLKNKKEIHNQIREIKKNDRYFFKEIECLNNIDDFDAMIELARSVECANENEMNFELSIDIEILTHKREVFAMYYDNIKI